MSVEEQIKKAMAEGAFDNLAGKGKPLDLEGYFQTPEHLRMCFSILKSGDFVPETAVVRDQSYVVNENTRA